MAGEEEPLAIGEYSVTFEEVAAALTAPETVLFIGSGISAWAKIISWKQLLLEFACHCDQYDPVSDDVLNLIESDNSHDLLEAADMLEPSISAGQYSDFFRNEHSFQEASPHAIHQLVMTLGPSCFITTNYDNLLEQASAASSTPLPLDVYSNLSEEAFGKIKMAGARRFLYKIHGDIASPESIILSRRSYAKLMNDQPAAYGAFKTLLQTRPVVLLGFGLRDPDFSSLLDESNAIYRDGGVQMYAIMPNVSAERRAYWKSNNVTIISYDAPEGDHSQLLALLSELKNRVVDIFASNKEETAEELGTIEHSQAANDNVLARLDALEAHSSELTKVILSALHWTELRQRQKIIDAVQIIVPEAEDEIIENQIERLALNNIVRTVGAAVLPVDTALVRAVGIDRVADAEKFLGEGE